MRKYFRCVILGCMLMASTPITLLGYQRDLVQSDARFNWCNWSRQVGKSFGTSLRRILRGAERRRNQIFLSASERQSRELMVKAKQHVQAIEAAERVFGLTKRAMTKGKSPGDFELDIDEQKVRFEGDYDYTQLTIRLPIGIRIVGLPANAETARGYTGDVLLDEFAMHTDDRGIWASVFPSVLRGGGELDVCSTPKGCKNLFYRLRSNPQFSRSTVTIHDAVAQGLEVDIPALREAMEDDDLWRQEFECEFLDEATAFLTYEMIAACQDVRLTKTLDFDELRNAENPWYVGVDIARKRHLTVFWLAEQIGPILWTRGVVEMAKQKFKTQAGFLDSIMQHPKVRRACIDATGIGAQLAEEARDRWGMRCEEVVFGPRVNESLATGLYTRVEDRGIRIPDDTDVRNDWHSIEKDVTVAGNIRFVGEETKSVDGSKHVSHADRFWAAALCVHAAGNAGVPGIW